MRIHINTTQNIEPVPFDYQQKMVGTIHKWIGKNSIHDKISLYSFSWLNGAKANNGFLQFPHGASFFLSFYDEDVIRQIIKTILSDSVMFCGMSVIDVRIDDEPDLSQRDVFYCASPILVKRRLEDGTIKQYNYNDSHANQFLKETMLSKMREAGLEEDESLEIHFDTSFPMKKLKLVHYHGIGNKASFCPVIIKGKAATKLFAWNVGLGNSTGAGFGAIY